MKYTLRTVCYVSSLLGLILACTLTKPISTTPSSDVLPSTADISEIDGMTLVSVPAGEFMMGSDFEDDYDKDNRPAHTVYVDAFWIDQTEVTNEMYLQCVQSGDCEKPYSYENYIDDPERLNHPVIYVSWDDAANYCAWAGRRLPTEAEWEKAASWDEKSKTKYKYPWGNTFDCSLEKCGEMGNLHGYSQDTVPVASFEKGKSPYGAYDMADNVWEWVEDWYDVYPGGDVSASPYFGKTHRILRGGSWNENYYSTFMTERNEEFPTMGFWGSGIRCARSAITP